MSLEELEQSKNSIVAKIREEVKSQKELWQRVPLLALMANMRRNYVDKYRVAYEQGLWELESSYEEKGDYYGFNVMVDLAEGNLVDAFHFENNTRGKINLTILAKDEEIISLLKNPEEIDAQKIITSLKKEAKKPWKSSYFKKLIPSHRTLRKELGLEEIFTRK